MVFGKSKKVPEKIERSVSTSFWAGAIAGIFVDVTLYPLDTIKTRLQSHVGFWKSGGFRGIYKGILPTAVGSAPTAAVFFGAYTSFKLACQGYVHPNNDFLVQVVAASVGEVTSALVRVPTEVVKQRRQACTDAGTSLAIVKATWKKGGVLGFYQGFVSTVLRDAPFSIIQYPLWEYFKDKWRIHVRREPTPPEGALCGAIGGAIAGAVTTPLDVVKTRIMLSTGCTKREEASISQVIKGIYHHNGLRGFFAGFVPRVVWIFLGGGVFFGVYEQSCVLIDGV
ncbi:hypothetical protein O3M35_001931 [Rhynocoris fuscipes]|uniref:S-adenosylmethionine mitochondrial carrier protein n=1 Tax=Rhynocoris fuscipes TaxID=488301 RepID=A0AAW1CQ58_9HEMI